MRGLPSIREFCGNSLAHLLHENTPERSFIVTRFSRKKSDLHLDRCPLIDQFVKLLLNLFVLVVCIPFVKVFGSSLGRDFTILFQLQIELLGGLRAWTPGTKHFISL